MSSPQQFIKPETLAIFQAHQKKLKEINVQVSELPSRPDKPNVFSYEDRYELKKRDESKQRFCEDVRVSKEYEHWLMDYSHLLVKNIQMFFQAKGDRFEE